MYLDVLVASFSSPARPSVRPPARDGSTWATYGGTVDLFERERERRVPRPGRVALDRDQPRRPHQNHRREGGTPYPPAGRHFGQAARGRTGAEPHPVTAHSHESNRSPSLTGGGEGEASSGSPEDPRRNEVHTGCASFILRPHSHPLSALQRPGLTFAQGVAAQPWSCVWQGQEKAFIARKPDPNRYLP